MNFLRDHPFKIYVTGYGSKCRKFMIVILQESIPSPTLFNIAVKINGMIYTDDLTLWASDTDPVHVNDNIQIPFNKKSKWSIRMSLTKSECVLFKR